MKTIVQILILCMTILFFRNIKAQQEDDGAKAEDSASGNSRSPFKIEMSYTSDLVQNSLGGIKNGSVFLGMANIKISFDTKSAGLWENGEIFINAVNTHGGRPTNDLIGDYQGISNIEAGNLTCLQELWIKQDIGSFSFSAGLQDLSAEFAVSEYGAMFLNGSFGVHSTISHNIPAPVFPLTSLGIHVDYKLSEELIAKIAAFDGLPDNFDNNPYNLSWKLNSDDGVLTFSEFTYSKMLISGLPGVYRFGAYYHNHLNRTDQAGYQFYTNDYGFYIVADQMIIKKLDGKKLALFTQAGLSPSQKNENNFYLGAGINYSGFWDSRKDDELGLAIAHAAFSNSLRRNETAVELSYKSQLNSNIFIQPDLQYIVHPAGTGEKLNNTLAAIIRMGINL